MDRTCQVLTQSRSAGCQLDVPSEPIKNQLFASASADDPLVSSAHASSDAAVSHWNVTCIFKVPHAIQVVPEHLEDFLSVGRMN